MSLLILALIVLVLIFGFVVVFGAPYLPTMKKHTDDALDMLDLKPGQTLLELGSGDGRVARRAAERGLRVVGYELNPVLVVIAKLTTWRYRSQVRIHWASFWQADWPPTDGIFIFLIARFMKRLDKKIIQQYKNRPIRLVSYAFEIPGKRPVQTKQGMNLYTYGPVEKSRPNG